MERPRKKLETRNQFTANGKDVRYNLTTFVPNEAHCMCLFEACNPKVVREMNEAAQILFPGIVEALDPTLVKFR